MAQKFYIMTFFSLAALMSVLEFLAYKLHWYWRFWWFDIIMHTIGGILVSLVTVWYFFVVKRYPVQKSFVFTFSLAAISAIGVGWELFEFKFGKLIFFGPHDPVDTAKDLFFDGVGTILGALFFLTLYNKRNEDKK